MPQNGKFIIDESIDEELRKKIFERVADNVDQVKSDESSREPIYRKRRDFHEGRHHKYTNVWGQGNKQQEGHILAVFNYIGRFLSKVHWSLTNVPHKMKIQGKDESNEIETSRAEMVQDLIYKIMRENKFWEVIFDRASMNQIREGDFMIDCMVREGKDGKKIIINNQDDMLKAFVGWDDSSGRSFSFIGYSDQWTLQKIKREFDYDAEPSGHDTSGTQKVGSHMSDQYGMLAGVDSADNIVPSGENKLPK